MPGNGRFGIGAFGEGLFGGTGYPVFTDEIAFPSDPFDVPQIWTSIPRDLVKQRSWRRGRQSERDLPGTGTSTTILDNSGRQFDPANVASTYYPNVIPMRRIRSRAVVQGITYDLYSNFIDIQQGWQLNQVDAGWSEAIVNANDGFDVLSARKLTAATSFPQQTSGARVAAILDAVGWPAAERDLDLTSQQSDVQAAIAGSLTGVSAQDAINAAVTNDNGIFYFDGRGYTVYRGRHRQTDTRYSTSQATFSDKSNWLPGYFLYTRAQPLSSKIINDYRVTRQGGAEMAWSDAVSIKRFGQRNEPVSTLHTTDGEALNYAQWRIMQDKDPRRRYDELVLTPGDDGDMWRQVFSRQLGDRITVIQSPPGGGSPDVRDLRIEAVDITVGPGMEGSCKWRLSPVIDLGGWTLGDAVYGLLGSTTSLTY